MEGLKDLVPIGNQRCFVKTKSYGNSQSCYNPVGGVQKDLFNGSAAGCKVCLKLRWEFFPASDVSYSKGIQQPPEDPEHRFVTTTLNNLMASESSCDSCRLVVAWFKRGWEVNGVVFQIPLHQLAWKTINIRITLRLGYTTLLEIYQDPFKLIAELYRNQEENCGLRTTSIGTAPHIASLPSLECCVDFIRPRLAKCKAYHITCTKLTPPRLPTRVIDVGNSAVMPRLVESGGQQAEYLTLSHCWGRYGHRPLRTTSFSLAAHCEEISWISLGATFRDAILIIRALGFKFLWIDSLCIIQDSSSDWVTESARMAEVYENSILTLSATGSCDGRGGCLFPRRRRKIAGYTVPQTNQSTGEELEGSPGIFVRKPTEFSHRVISQAVGGLKSGAPLLSRAWAYQENVLSPRTIHFHTEELIWECRNSADCECGYLDWESRIVLKYSNSVNQSRWKSPYAVLSSESYANRHDDVHECWNRAVEAYSGMRLTYDADRLPALAGLASRFAEILKTQYLAGLWRLLLPKSLLWASSMDVRSRRLLSQASTIPTWSWASVIRASDATELRNIDYSLASPKHASSVDERIQVLAAMTEISNTNLFGHTLRGTLRLSGALIPGIIVSFHPALQANNISHSVLIGGQNYKANPPLRMTPSMLIFDIVHDGKPEEVAEGDGLYFFLIAQDCSDPSDYDSSGPRMYSLALKKLQDQTYKRVGLLKS